MANPPIVIGQFDNVPAPGSPIRSDWPQEISTAVTALQAAYPAILVGQSPTGGAQTVGTSATALTGLSTTFTAIAGARYVVLGQVGARQVGADGLIRMQIVASTPSAVIGGAWNKLASTGTRHWWRYRRSKRRARCRSRTRCTGSRRPAPSLSTAANLTA